MLSWEDTDNSVISTIEVSVSFSIVMLLDRTVYTKRDIFQTV